MLKRKTTVWQVMLLGILLMLSSCYHRHNSHQQHAAMVEYSDRQLDSISFSTTHHYTNKYNFLVFKDSLELMRQQPEEYISGLKVDTFAVKKNHLLVVTDIRMVPQDSIDSVWVQLATENNDFGWVRESKLLRRVVPDDPISEFIMTFSNVHLLIFLVVIVVITMAYLVRKVFHSNGKIVHFNDIDSPYPVTLVLLVSISAAFYGWIQSFEPEMWRHFYFHPSLNPFAVPHLLGVFLALVWAVLIVALACVDEVYHRLTFGEGLLYLGGLAGVCALDYIIFSVLSLYYIGYVLLIAYIYFAIKTYRRK
ncbi:zinc ribbon domain-containing protein [Segatella copri]|uniref:zinc ribbon domain-containing protein n=1 Tax=Segatella copri TaxID=165179 RepID=UPI0020CA6789|nr:zinc ribbon domain-containing protein [Segatella copri]